MTIPNFALDGRIAVVTGAGSGLGTASAAALAAYGARVAVVDIDADAARAVADRIGDNAHAFACDIADEQQVAECVARIAETLGQVTILHNNAAIHMGYGRGDVQTHAIDSQVWLKIVSVNLNGTFFMTKHILPHMLAAKKGSIINTASLAGPILGSSNTAYTATKGAVAGYTKALVISYAKTGIRANTICPGFVATPMSQPVLDNPEDLQRYASDVPAGRTGVPDDVGGLVVFLASDASSYVNGAQITLDGGISLR